MTHVEPFSCYGAVVLSVCRRNRGLWHVRGATPLALCRAAPAPLGTVALLWRQRGATVALPWRYRGATVALPWRYRGATVALPWRSRGVHRSPLSARVYASTSPPAAARRTLITATITATFCYLPHRTCLTLSRHSLNCITVTSLHQQVASPPAMYQHVCHVVLSSTW